MHVHSLYAICVSRALCCALCCAPVFVWSAVPTFEPIRRHTASRATVLCMSAKETESIRPRHSDPAKRVQKRSVQPRFLFHSSRTCSAAARASFHIKYAANLALPRRSLSQNPNQVRYGKDYRSRRDASNMAQRPPTSGAPPPMGYPPGMAAPGGHMPIMPPGAPGMLPPGASVRRHVSNPCLLTYFFSLLFLGCCSVRQGRCLQEQCRRVRGRRAQCPREQCRRE